MVRLLRSFVVCVALTVGASAALADDVPFPIWPPDPWEEAAAATDQVPFPIWPPDPWE